jgi:L-threonylcarbamoyladenylate synthase
VSALRTTDIGQSAAALRDGGLVALPTETVYGLGALARDPQAVARVFEVKGRPANHPLIVHLAAVTQIGEWSTGVPAWATELARELWPGPLTLIVPKSAGVNTVVTGGQDTIGLRVPAHPLALQLLATLDDGVAAPSANRFGAVSPTTADHVIADLGPWLDSRTDLVLDGGPCTIGLESTIVLAIDDQPRLLRPGGVSVATIESITGLTVAEADGSVRAPGTLASHYAPHAQVLLTTAERLADVIVSGAGLIAPAEVETPDTMTRLEAPANSAEYAATLYSALRRADDLGLAIVIAIAPDQTDALAAAVNDRLSRAAHSLS